MAKIISFQKMKQVIKKRKETEEVLQGTEDHISAILNDYSLTPANRHWKLENLLMNVDEQLDQYRKDLETAERKLNALVSSAEHEIAKAYGEFESQVRGMTRAVRKLGLGAPSKGYQEGDAGGDAP